MSLYRISDQLGDALVESPIEADFFVFYGKYALPNINVQSQVRIPTMLGTMRMDFVATSPEGKVVAFELDGSRWHKDKFRDEIRDAAILATGEIDSLWRIPAFGMYYNYSHVFHLISKQDPEVFDSDAEYASGVRMAWDEYDPERDDDSDDNGYYWVSYEHDSQAPRVEYVTQWGAAAAILELVRHTKIDPPGRYQDWQELANLVYRRGFTSVAEAREALGGER